MIGPDDRDDRVALVTGAGSGIGAAIAVRLARDGLRVVVNDRSVEMLDSTMARIAQFEGRARAVAGDVTQPDDVGRMLDSTLGAFDQLDVAVNNAGSQSESRFLDLDFADWRDQLAVDLDGVFLLSSAAARHMAPRGGGVILNVTSVHEHVPRPGYSAYCVAKAGVGMLTQCLGRELAPHHIRVVGVAPGAIDTPINRDALDTQDKVDAALAGIPAHRIGRPEEVAALVSYLISPEADYITATTVVIDGGLEQDVSTS